MATEREPLVPKRWEGVSDGEWWRVEVDHDRFSDVESWVVALAVTHHDDEGLSETLACPSPSQAREMAAALLVYAHFAEKANAREGS